MYAKVRTGYVYLPGAAQGYMYAKEHWAWLLTSKVAAEVAKQETHCIAIWWALFFVLEGQVSIASGSNCRP